VVTEVSEERTAFIFRVTFIRLHGGTTEIKFQKFIAKKIPGHIGRVLNVYEEQVAYREKKRNTEYLS
jgi:hypothetical protein